MSFQDKRKANWSEDSSFGQINMNRYTDFAIRNAIKAVKSGLENDKIEAGFLLKIDAVDMLEQLLIARDMLKDTDPIYFKAVEDFAGALDEKMPGSDSSLALLKEAKKANFKFRLLLKIVDEGELKEVEMVV